MKIPKLALIGLGIVAVVVAITLFLRSQQVAQPRALPGSAPVASAIGSKVGVLGAPPFLRDLPATMTEGFLEIVQWNADTRKLQLQGWSPLGTHADSTTFWLRDPFGRFQLTGVPEVISMERPDVAAAHPGNPAMLHAGFRITLTAAETTLDRAALDSLELYASDGRGTLHRLTRLDIPLRTAWQRSHDCYELVVTFADVLPEGAKPAKRGSLDVLESGANREMRFAGWAEFDGSSPRSLLVIQLPAEAAPAAIVNRSWVSRPDVRAKLASENEALDRSGFDLTLRLSTSPDILRRPGAIRLWSIDGDGSPAEISLNALKKK